MCICRSHAGGQKTEVGGEGGVEGGAAGETAGGGAGEEGRDGEQGEKGVEGDVAPVPEAEVRGERKLHEGPLEEVAGDRGDEAEADE